MKTSPKKTDRLILNLMWFLFGMFILFTEYILFVSEDQMITSSGDSTYRQHWISIVIGYGIIIILYFISVRKKIDVRFPRAVRVLTFMLAFFICTKNQHCIVFGSNGNRFVEFYTPFYRSESIGCAVDLNSELSYPFTRKNISDIIDEGNTITFKRPLVKDYHVTKLLLFWYFDFPADLKTNYQLFSML